MTQGAIVGLEVHVRLGLDGRLFAASPGGQGPNPTEALARSVAAEHAEAMARLAAGQHEALKFLVGQAMRRAPNADPQGLSEQFALIASRP